MWNNIKEIKELTTRLQLKIERNIKNETFISFWLEIQMT